MVLRVGKWIFSCALLSNTFDHSTARTTHLFIQLEQCMELKERHSQVLQMRRQQGRRRKQLSCKLTWRWRMVSSNWWVLYSFFLNLVGKKLIQSNNTMKNLLGPERRDLEEIKCASEGRAKQLSLSRLPIHLHNSLWSLFVLTLALEGSLISSCLSGTDWVTDILPFRSLLQKRSHELSTSALNHTTHLLGLNPELYTCWNYRREIMLRLFQNPSAPSKKVDFFASAKASTSSNSTSTEPSTSTTQSETSGTQLGDSSIEENTLEAEQPPSEQRKAEYKFELLSDDLEITMHALRAHPKVYWIWNHRKWCLEQLPEISPNEVGSKWKREMKVVEKMLELDPRNCEFLTHFSLNVSISLLTCLCLTTLSPWLGLSTIPSFADRCSLDFLRWTFHSIPIFS